MAAHNYVHNEPTGMTDRIAAFFANRDNAYRAVEQLKGAGFASENIVSPSQRPRRDPGQRAICKNARPLFLTEAEGLLFR